MPKRSAKDKIERYNKTIRKLEEKERQTRRRVMRVLESSDSDVSFDNDANNDADKVDRNGPANAPALEVTDIPEIPVPDTGILETEALDPEILSALGEQSDDTPEFGESIHENLAQRWQPILKKGLPKEAKDKLLKEYLVPSNCALLQAPKLNAEISAAITDMARNRDKKMELSQQLLGAGITAVNRAMTLLITGEEKIQAIKMLSDSCRILTYLHHMDTEARIKLVTPGLERSFLNVIKDNERDSTLFGIKLSEKIKASKAIERQGLQIKKIPLPPKPPQTAQSAVARPRYQENWPGPSRYLSNRGGARRPEETSPCSTQGTDSGATEVLEHEQNACSTSTIEQVHSGRISHFYSHWLDITSNDIVLEWIRKGFSIPFSETPVQTFSPRNGLSTSDKDDMNMAIKKLLDLGAISTCSPTENQFISKIFLTSKPNGDKRFILNLKPLNKFISKFHFKMEDYRTVTKLLPQDGYMAKIDLKEAYLLIPIANYHRKYLRFHFENEKAQNILYEFNSMPYGLSIAPRTFTKIMKEVMSHLRSRGYKSVQYLDDVLCIGDTYSECRDNLTETLKLLESLGFVINFDKSSLEPKQTCTY